MPASVYNDFDALVASIAGHAREAAGCARRAESYIHQARGWAIKLELSGRKHTGRAIVAINNDQVRNEVARILRHQNLTVVNEPHRSRLLVSYEQTGRS